MFDRLSYLGLLAVVLTFAGWLYFHAPEPAPPTPCTCADLAANPTLYAGKPVLVSTAGTEPTRHGTLTWRRASHEPPAVVLVWAGSTIPPHLCGSCRAPIAPGAPVRVIGCRVP